MDVEQRVVAKAVAQAREVQRVEIKAQQGGVDTGRVRCKVVADGGIRVVQRRQQRRGQLRVHRISFVLPCFQFDPAAVQPAQRGLHIGGGQRAHGIEPLVNQLRGIHFSAALDQVVRLVHQHANAPVPCQRHAEQHRVQVEVVVVVTHHHVAPAHQLLRQVVGTNAVLERGAAQRRLVHRALRQRSAAGLWQAVVEALGQRARIAVARLVGVLAGLVSRHQFEHTQMKFGRAVLDACQRMQRQTAARAFCGQKEQLVEPLRRCGLQKRKQGADGFADAGGCLGGQATARAGGLVDRL